MNDLSHEEHLLDLTIGFSVAGAAAGGAVTVLTLLSPSARLALSAWALPAALLVLAVCTSGVMLCGLAYLGRRAATGRLDASVWRALPLFFFLLVPILAPWTRFVMWFPRFVEGTVLISTAIGGIALCSLIQLARGTNRLSTLFAAVNLCQYGALAAGLTLATFAWTPPCHPSPHHPLPHHRPVMLRGATVLK